LEPGAIELGSRAKGALSLSLFRLRSYRIRLNVDVQAAPEVTFQGPGCELASLVFSRLPQQQ
jgi:hypothetical protein